MIPFVTGLLFVQFLLGAYQFSIVANAGRPESVARATRLPTGTVFAHLVIAVVAALVWLVFQGTGWKGLAWTTFIVLVIGGSLGTFMGLRTVGRPRTLPETQGTEAEAANLIVVERQIPTISIALHGLFGLTLIVFTLLVALGVSF